MGLSPSRIPRRFACLNAPERNALQCRSELRPRAVCLAIVVSIISRSTVRKLRKRDLTHARLEVIVPDVAVLFQRCSSQLLLDVLGKVNLIDKFYDGLRACRVQRPAIDGREKCLSLFPGGRETTRETVKITRIGG